MICRRSIPDYVYYLLALGLALFVRLLNLGALPLSDSEATLAMQSLGIVRGLKPLLSSHVTYDLLTASLFYLFEATNFMARFWPAMVGSLLVLAPWPVSRHLGRIPAILVAFGLALDPGLVAISRQAGSDIFSLTFLLLVAVLWIDKRYPLAGVCAALALLSGPASWYGLIVLLLAWLVFRAVAYRPRSAKPNAAQASNEAGVATSQASELENTVVQATGVEALPLPATESLSQPPAVEEAVPIPEPTPPSLRQLIWPDMNKAGPWFIVTLVGAGTLFLLVPGGLSAAFSALPDFLRGWMKLPAVKPWVVLLALPAYELLPLVFGLIAVVRGVIKRDRLSLGLSIWAGLALLMPQVYPGRAVADLAWTLIPLWGLAATEISRHLDWAEPGRKEAIIAAVITFVMLVFSWMSLSGVPDAWGIPEVMQTHLGLSIGALLLVILCLLLVGVGWSLDIARRGGVWGSLVALSLFTVGMGTSAAGLRRPVTVELWQPAPLIVQADLLLETLDQVSDLSQGCKNSLPVQIVGIDSPSLRWLLRDYAVQESGALAVDSTPEVVILPQGVEPNLPAPYRGQDFIWRAAPTWDLATTPQWVRWFVFRSMPQTEEYIILWVRSDLLPGGEK
jgi:hypothetical protein